MAGWIRVQAATSAAATHNTAPARRYGMTGNLPANKHLADKMCGLGPYWLVRRSGMQPSSGALVKDIEHDWEVSVAIFGTHKTRMIAADEALPGRSEPVLVPAAHEVLGTPLRPP